MSRRWVSAIPATILGATLLYGCPRAEPEQERVGAVVTIIKKKDEQKTPVAVITETAYRHELARMRLSREGTLQAAPLPAKLKTAVLEQLIQRRLILLEADRLDVQASTTAVARHLARAHEPSAARETRKRLIATFQTEADLRQATVDRLRMAAVLRSQAHAGVSVEEDEIVKAWDALPEAEKKVPKRVRASQIVVRTEEEGKKIVTALKRGKDFAELARTRSLGPEGARGGDLGWLEPDIKPKVFAEVCFSLKPGQTSPLTPSEYGFHIFRVMDAKPAQSLTLDAIRDRLKARVLHKKLEGAEAAYLAALRARFELLRDEPLLGSIK